MNRKLIAAAAAVVLLGVTLVGGAAVTGTQAKKKLQAAPLAWQAQWPMLKVVEQHYDRGLFSATHTVTLQFGCEGGSTAAANAPAAFTLVQRVQHGPLPGFAGVGAAVVDTELVLPEAARKALAELTGNQPLLTAHSVVGLGGATQTRLAMAPLRISGPQGQLFAWQGLTLDLRDGGSTLQYDLALPGFEMVQRDERMALQMKLAGVRVHGEMSNTGSLWARAGRAEGELGHFEMLVEAANAQAMPPLKFALSQLKLTSDNTLDKELLTSVARFSGQGLVNDIKLDKIELQTSFKRLHTPNYERLVQHVMDTSAAACDMKQTVSPQVILAQLQQDLLALLPFNPEYALDKLALEINGKRGELSYALGVNGVTEADTKLPLPALLLSKGQVRGRASLPSAWVEQTLARFGGAGQGDAAAQAEMMNVMLTKITDEGYVVREGEMLNTQFSFENGQMLVNGKPVGRPPAQ